MSAELPFAAVPTPITVLADLISMSASVKTSAVRAMAVIVQGQKGYEALFTEQKTARLTAPRDPDEVDPRGYMTGRLPENKSFWL